MRFSLSRALIIARREYLTTVRRKAFVFWLLYTPTILFFSTFVSQKLAGDDMRAHFQQARIVAVVDSSGQFGAAPREYLYVPQGQRDTTQVAAGMSSRRAESSARVQVPVLIRPFASQAQALDSLDAGSVNAVLVIARDYASTGGLRRYEKDTRAVTTSADDRPLRSWLTRGLLGAHADSTTIARAWGLGGSIPLYTPARGGGYALKDDAKEMVAIFLPLVMGMLLGMSIMMGGQYMIQGIAEEKESRILESLLCTVTPDDLMLGKLIGLGGAGLTLVAAWVAVGMVTLGTSLAFLNVDVPVQLLVLGLLYFLGGYVFYGSLMTGIGSITNNQREAQQMSAAFTILLFFPFWVLVKIINAPNSGIAVGLSMFPPTAATTMAMRLSASSVSGAVIPAWQIAASLLLLALTALGTVFLCARIFRVGLLMYGKTPNLPELMSILRQK